MSSNDGDVDCDGSCRDNCNCAECGETHYCDSETDCNARNRMYKSGRNDHWEYALSIGCQSHKCQEIRFTEWIERI